ncbi:probable 39S ribosomal protein L24, mitochondrial [Aplysia californica]|uniref:Probable 39S ribosomal protein L24, mitochondrial n=1 Tax=Aplysia californica TaxID=6500 RepID=A0ABM1VRV4_APLCA|nr:probable 39S ribosomal protein L24, mitochondrial [Aplysia californica]XP_035825146.1 probable 39S ribosomal protein L24, mitochondrial [Aplysia californica]
MRLTVVACGYFKKYVQREIAKASGYSLYKPLQGWRHVRKRQWIYDENQPWTDAAKETNFPGKKLRELIEPIPQSQWMIFKGDRVLVLKGIDKGKIGIVCMLVKERNWCFVEGLNCNYRWVDRSTSNPGVLSKVEKPLLVTNEVALLDPSDQQPTQVEWRFDEDGNRVRVSLRSGRIVPISEKYLDEAEDGVLKSSYIEQNWDTKEKELTKVTYKPSLSSFEADIMQAMGIKEDRKRAPVFYY